MSASATTVDEIQEGRFISTSEVRTFLHEAGEGPPVLLLHGSGPGVSAWANWRLVLPELARDFRTIAYDQLGFGRSGRPDDGNYGRLAWTRHALAVLDALELDRVHLIGNSMGGSIALSIANERPDLVDRIVLMGTSGIPTRMSAGLDKVWGYTPENRERMRELIELFVYDDSIATDDLVELRFDQSRDEESRASYETMFPAPRQRWLDDLALAPAELAEIKHPTLLIHGHDDKVIPFASSLLALDLLPNAELHCFQKCGHWVQIEQAGRFVDVVTDFLGTESL